MTAPGPHPLHNAETRAGDIACEKDAWALAEWRERWYVAAQEAERWEHTARDAIALADRLQEALWRARDCCARPMGVCLDPHLIDGDR